MATAFGLAAALSLLANAALSVRALWLSADDLRLAGVSLIDWLGLATLLLNGVWYGLINALAWRRRAWSRGLCLLGLAAGVLSFVPPLAPLLLMLAVVWSAGLGWSWLREAATAGALPKSSDWRWRGLSWAPVVTLAGYTLFLIVRLSLGGLGRVHAWLDLQVMLPLFGALILIAVSVYAVATRRLHRALVMTGGLALVVDMEVRLSGVARVPATSQHLAGRHDVAGRDLQATGLKVREDQVRPRLKPLHNPIAFRRRDVVGRHSRDVVGFALVRAGDERVNRGEDGQAVTAIVLKP